MELRHRDNTYEPCVIVIARIVHEILSTNSHLYVGAG